MFYWNALFIFATMMFAMSRLPERQWFSATVISFALGLIAISTQSIAAAEIAGEKVPFWQVGYWIFFCLLSIFTAKDVIGDWLTALDQKKKIRKAARAARKAAAR